MWLAGSVSSGDIHVIIWFDDPNFKLSFQATVLHSSRCLGNKVLMKEYLFF